MDGGTSQLVLFHVKRHFGVMCCLILSLLRKLSSTSSDGVRSGNLDVRLPLVAFFFGRRMHGFFQKSSVYITALHRHSFVDVPLA
jgi:hypothetical protein